MNSVKKYRPLFWVTTAILVGTSQLLGQFHPVGRVKTTTSIQVEMIKSGEAPVPAEFQVALYENLLDEIKEKDAFEAVYRDGDKDAQSNSNLVIMRASITRFQEGSQRDRQVTTVKGATKIMVHCQFTDIHGAILLERDIQGQVRFFGDNLKATEDFAKKAAKAADEVLSTYRATPGDKA